MAFKGGFRVGKNSYGVLYLALCFWVGDGYGAHTGSSLATRRFFGFDEIKKHDMCGT